jgi:hypothetical protein
MNTTEYLIQLIGKGQNALLQGVCHDCKVPVEIAVDIQPDGQVVSTGPFWWVEGVGGFSKCPECFENEPRLTEYQPCEVFSRVCGYLRPVKQFNLGKKAEKEYRQDFVL